MKRPISFNTVVRLVDDLTRDSKINILLAGIESCRVNHGYTVFYSYKNHESDSYILVVKHKGEQKQIEIKSVELNCYQDVVSKVSEAMENNVKNEMLDRFESLKVRLRELFNITMEYRTALTVYNATKITLTFRDLSVSFIIPHHDIDDHLEDIIGKHVADLIMNSI